MPRRVHEFETSRFGGRAEITGFRAGDGRWHHLAKLADGRRRWYTGQPGGEGGNRHRGRAPNDLDLKEGREFAVHIRYRGKDYYYTYHTPRGVSGRLIEADFRARIKAGYFRRHGAKRT